MIVCFVFFSSRRRHTRYWRDWSSDVCSSDLRRDVERTGDGHWLVVDGRRWRAADPELPDDVRARLLHHLGVARSAVRTAGDDAARAAARARVQLAKTGLGERGTAWWVQDDAERCARWERSEERRVGKECRSRWSP